MFILYFDSTHHEYYHANVYNGWTAYDKFRPGEGFWLVPGTDPDDGDYGRDYQDQVEDEEDECEDEQADQTLEYMCELLEANEIEVSEFRRQLRSEGYNEETIRLAIRRILPYGSGG